MEIDGELREIINVVEDKTGRLIIRIRSAELYGFDSGGVETTRHKVSVHLPRAGSRHSLIHMTQILHNKTVVHRHTVTDVLAEQTGFTHVYFRHCSNIAREYFATKPPVGPNESQKIIGKFISQAQAVVHSIATGSSKCDFTPYSIPNVSVNLINFDKINVVILLTAACNLPSHSEGSFIYNLTIPPEHFADHPRSRAMAEELMRGLNPQQCCDEFWFTANLLLGGFIKRRIEQEPNMSPQQRSYLSGYHGVFATEVRKYVPKVREGFVQLHVDERYWSFNGTEADDRLGEA